MENYNVKEVNGYLVKEKIDRNMMNLHNKEFLQLSAPELQREIDYTWGVYDYITQSEYLTENIKKEQAEYMWKKLDVMTTRFLHLSMRSIRDNMDKITEEIIEMRKN